VRNIHLSPSIFLFAPFPLLDKISSGNYPLRHEIIIFYLAAALRGVKFHPDESCTQMSTPNQTTLFAYNDNDPSVYSDRLISDRQRGLRI